MIQFRITKNGAVSFQTKFLDCSTAEETLTFLTNYLKGMILSQKDDVSVDKLRCWHITKPLATHMEKIVKEDILAEAKEVQEKYLNSYRTGLNYVRPKGGLHYQDLKKE